MKRILILSALIFTAFSAVNAQIDSIITINDNHLIGEVKTMDRGVLTMETDYSDSDFKIEWEKVKEIYTRTYFLITLANGSRYNGTIKTSGPDRITIFANTGEQVETLHNDIVWLDDLDQGFWNQLYASIDIGFDMTKANNFRQVSARAGIGYMAERWNLDASYNTLFSEQDETSDIRRTDGSVGYKYFLPKDWYPLASVNFLSNTEQLLDLRTTGRLGMGKFLVHTNNSYWGISMGANYNNENFSNETPDRKSWEGFFGTELNLFDVGDLSLMTKWFVYPSITESGRWRSDFNIDTRYEMPFDDDFYIKIGLTYNYDNKPIEGASEDDYVFHTGFGWSW